MEKEKGYVYNSAKIKAIFDELDMEDEDTSVKTQEDLDKKDNSESLEN